MAADIFRNKVKENDIKIRKNSPEAKHALVTGHKTLLKNSSILLTLSFRTSAHEHSFLDIKYIEFRIEVLIEEQCTSLLLFSLRESQQTRAEVREENI